MHKEIVVSSEGEALEALEKLRDGQTLRLAIGRLQSRDSSSIDASHVHVVGDEDKTTVLCPETAGAFFIG